METPAFITTFSGQSLATAQRNHVSLFNVSTQERRPVWVMCEKQRKKGLFGRLKEGLLRPLVTVPGSGGRGDVLECVFCNGTGRCDCDACKGSGKDALGRCMMCEGKTHLQCTVCNGVGAVDRVRRGGTDDRNEYITKKRI